MWRVSSKDEFEDGDEGGDLADPKKKHPFDNFRLQISPVLLGHEAFGKVVFLFPKSQFQTLRNGPRFQRFDLGGFQDREDLCCAHYPQI